MSDKTSHTSQTKLLRSLQETTIKTTSHVMVSHFQQLLSYHWNISFMCQAKQAVLRVLWLAAFEVIMERCV